MDILQIQLGDHWIQVTDIVRESKVPPSIDHIASSRCVQPQHWQRQWTYGDMTCKRQTTTSSNNTNKRTWRRKMARHISDEWTNQRFSPLSWLFPRWRWVSLVSRPRLAGISPMEAEWEKHNTRKIGNNWQRFPQHCLDVAKWATNWCCLPLSWFPPKWKKVRLMSRPRLAGILPVDTDGGIAIDESC